MGREEGIDILEEEGSAEGCEVEIGLVIDEIEEGLAGKGLGTVLGRISEDNGGDSTGEV